MTYMKIKSREQLSGCTCGSKKILSINSPITGYTCPDCGATKDRYEKLKKAFAAAKELLDHLYFPDEMALPNEVMDAGEEYEGAVQELEE